jgi:hypothetical protein
MRAFHRIATVLLLAILLAVASVPCPNAKRPNPEPGALAGAAAHPCPGHANAGDAPSLWLDSLCPCGCEEGAPPGGDGMRAGPALLLATISALCAPDRGALLPPTLRLARPALAPPDHVPLAIA